MSTAIDYGALITVDWNTSNCRAALLDDSGGALDRVDDARGVLPIERGGFVRVFDAMWRAWLARLPGVPGLVGGPP